MKPNMVHQLRVTILSLVVLAATSGVAGLTVLAAPFVLPQADGAGSGTASGSSSDQPDPTSTPAPTSVPPLPVP